MRFEIIAVSNGYTVSRSRDGGMDGFTVFVETYEQACQLVVEFLRAEGRMGY